MKQHHKIITRRVALVDSSAILALLDGDDVHHDEAIKALNYLLRSSYRLFMTNFILAEAHALILSNLGNVLACWKDIPQSQRAWEYSQQV